MIFRLPWGLHTISAVVAVNILATVARNLLDNLLMKWWTIIPMSYLLEACNVLCWCLSAGASVSYTAFGTWRRQHLRCTECKESLQRTDKLRLLFAGSSSCCNVVLINTLAVTYEISRTTSVLFSLDILRVNLYLT